MSRFPRSPIELLDAELQRERWDAGEIKCRMEGCGNRATRQQEIDADGTWITVDVCDDCEF